MIFLSEEVNRAVSENRPVVALESTIISHGMPYPQNVETALAVEDEVRKRGAVPATIAIIEGVPTVGCTRSQIEFLGKTGTKAVKVSRRDIPFVTAKKLTGATTVAATMIFAHMAGIKVFATGGIGGVHRGAEKTMDISADLAELQRTAVLVVCAGAKSILDIGLTLENLETRGVAVVGYRTRQMPAFYARESGFETAYRLDSAEEIAQAFFHKEKLNLDGGMLVANPVPEQYALESGYVNGFIDRAVAQAEKEGVHGKEVTPYLLEKVRELTEGRSLETNIKLVLNNAALAADVAKSLCALYAEEK